MRPPLFPRKRFGREEIRSAPFLLEDPLTNGCIEWFDEGRQFRFSSLDDLLKIMKARGDTKAKSIYSINKNINDYDLKRTSDRRKKVAGGDDPYAEWECFYNPFFKEGQRELLDYIKRRPHPSRVKDKDKAKKKEDHPIE
ncbi:hypothetical protein H4219_004623 [Mycoemilia scoparia]|uniref:HSF-type DNA-binding domain-containing protein n=1 Tax=Mycoemilia scoparia TaxID=417184 RepID=A0A9W7ZR09_9FUNG|nr:hypothetical protein H4219_004623 [Mycoemilia scoparia]